MKLLSRYLSLTLVLTVVGYLSQNYAAIAQTAYIYQIKGKVELKRKTWSQFRPVSRACTPLAFGDQLRRASKATVLVACPNGKKQPVRRAAEPAGLPDICPQWKGVISKGPPPLGPISGIDVNSPYLITPRRTLLLSHTPTLRWNSVPTATQYTVKIFNAAGLVWQTQVTEPQVTYPGKPALQPGIPYSVLIQADTGAASKTNNHQANEIGDEFIILHEAETKAIQSAVDQILQSDFTEEVKAFKLIDYYRDYELPNPAAYGLPKPVAKAYRLNAAAIARLEDLIASGSRSPLFYRTLGDLYWQTGLFRPAEANYLNAIDSVQSAEDLEDWAIAAFNLGELHAANHNPNQALLWYYQAKAGFNILEDKRVELINHRIDRLKREDK